MKAKSLAKRPPREPVKVEPMSRFATLPKVLKTRLAFPKESKATVVVDTEGSPRYFSFDTQSLWDVLCAIDTVFEEQVPDAEYVLRNPVGWLIDAIEARLPVSPKIVAKLKKGLEEATRLGTVPFETVKQHLGLP